MFAPFVFPEGLVVALVVFPVGAHVGEQVGLVVGFENGGDVGVGAGGVAASIVGPVAVVRPKTVDGPGIVRASAGICVPELRLEKLSTWGIEAAKICDNSRVLTTQLRIHADLGA